MTVLFLNRVYPPVEGATGQLLAQLAEGLAREGMDVTVLTTAAGDEAAVAAARGVGVRIERVRVLAFTRASHWRRALSYLSVYPRLFWRAWRLPRADVVVTMTDPPMLLVLGPCLKWFKGGRLLHWAQDLYPEVAEELGVLRQGGAMARLLRGLSTWALRQHDRVVAVGRCMQERLRARGLAEERIEVIPNWALQDSAAAAAEEVGAFRREHGLADRLVVMYSGNFGLAHPFEAILEAARRMRTQGPRLLFVFVGGGSRLGWLREQAASLSNVRFLPLQPVERLPVSLAAADLHLASMHESACGLVVPSKVYGILAAGRPCLFLGPKRSEVGRLIEEHGCGEVLPPAEAPALVEALHRWTEPAKLRQAQQAAAALAPGLGVAAAQAAFGEVLRRTAISGPS